MKKFVLLSMSTLMIFSLCACEPSGQQPSGKPDGGRGAASIDGSIQSSAPNNWQEEPQQPDNSSPTELAPSSAGNDGLRPLVSTTDTELSAYLVKAQDAASDLYGYIDIRTGEYVIEPRFSSCDDAFGTDGWAVVFERFDDRSKNSGSVINTSGELLFAYETLGNNFASVDEYEDGYIIVCPSFKDVPPAAYLYHGPQLVRELELPPEGCTTVNNNLAYYSDSRYTKPYTPERYISLSAELDSGDWVYLWYDTDGNLIYTSEDVGGCLAGDETGYYFIGEGYVNVIAPDGSVTETLETQSSEYCGKVAWDGDNWYVIINLTGKPMLYTNGLTPLFETGEIGSHYFTLDVTDGIVRGQDGMWYTLDGTVMAGPDGSRLIYYGDPFQNGYGQGCTKPSVTGTSEYYYIDTAGNKVFEIPQGQGDSYSTVLKGGYFVYGKDEMYGIMNLDGTVVTEMRFRHIYNL